MKKIYLFLALLFFINLELYGSHIVGGEFQLLHIQGQEYELRLVVYFDAINGNSGAIDNQVNARIFRKVDNIGVLDITLQFISQSRIEHFQPSCSNGEVITDRLLYSTVITLSPESFNDQGGYYIAWERCCRNYTLTNVISEDPQTGGQHAGQTFYLEFPAVIDQNGNAFVDSSPLFTTPLNDYACPNREYWINFNATDTDGDSLVYSLITPLSTHNPVAIPTSGPGAAPYPEVNWASPFGLENIFDGNPDLMISGDGLLKVTPQQGGLYAFGVKCKEYRNGIKIGEVNREFQLLVLSSCPGNIQPSIQGKKITDVNYTDVEFMEVFFDTSVSDDNRCINVRVSDLDSENVGSNYTENIYLKAIPIKFDPNEVDLTSILPVISNATLINGSLEEFNICFPECPLLDPQEVDYFDVGIIAFDDGCALPLSDTLVVRVRVEAPINFPTNIITAGNSISEITLVESQGIGQNISFFIEGVDADNRLLIMSFLTEGDFNLENAGISFSPPDTSIPGKSSTTFNWNLDCSNGNLDFSEGVTISDDGDIITKQYKIRVVVEDPADCSWSNTDTLMMNLNIQFPTELSPTVFQVGEGLSEDSLGYEFNLSEDIQLEINALDENGDNINLFAYGNMFDLETYGIQFEDKFDQPGVSPGIITPFSWFLDPETINLDEKDSFRIMFVTEDLDDCNITSGDTLLIDFIIGKLITGVSDINLSNRVSVYPVPSNRLIYVKLETSINEEVYFYLFDLKGTEVSSLKQVSIENNVYGLMIENNILSGTYILNTKIGSELFTKRVVIK